jgi:tetratricopeptide (TPR) repeat protein
LKDGAFERAGGLTLALKEDPGSIDLRLSAIEALMAARDFDAALQIAGTAPEAGISPGLSRALRFLQGASLLEAGRYLEAQDAFLALKGSKESAAVLNNLGVARFRLRDRDASGLFERASFFADHRQADIAFNRCLALLFEDKAEIALPALDDSLRANASDVRTRLLRVWALKLLGREAERGLEWERLTGIAPSFSSLQNPDLARRLERIFHSERSP